MAVTTPAHALVLTAGLGRRLRPLTDVRAKPAVPVAGEALIRRVLSWLAGQGVREAVLNLHHRPETITRVVGDGSALGLRVRYAWEPTLLGSAGGPRAMLPLLEPASTLIVNGDTLNSKLAAGSNRISDWISAGYPDYRIVESIYLAALSRYPTNREMSQVLTVFAETKPVQRRQLIEDLFWGVLSSREFLFNH